MSLGGQTIKFKVFTASGTPDTLGNRPLVEANYSAPGSRHRPLTFSETAELQTDIATEMWRSTIPVGEYESSLRNKVLSTPGDAVIEVNGQDYQIIGGVRHHVDMDGNPFKVTIVSKRDLG